MKSKWYIIIGLITSCLLIGCSNNQASEKFIGTWERTILKGDQTYSTELKIKDGGKFEVMMFRLNSPSNKRGLLGTYKAKRNKLNMKVERGFLEQEQLIQFDMYAVLEAGKLILHGDLDNPGHTTTFQKKTNN